MCIKFKVIIFKIAKLLSDHDIEVELVNGKAVVFKFINKMNVTEGSFFKKREVGD